MKKTKKSQKVLIAMIVIAFFSVACAAVVYAATHFWSTYGTSGALSDGKLTKEEWNNLMTDLDGLSCNSSCPTCPTCNCNGTKAYLSPDSTTIRAFTSGMPSDGSADIYDRYLYDAVGNMLNYSIQSYAGQCSGGGRAGSWSMSEVYSNSNNTKFCAYVTQCEDVRGKTYYVHVNWNWIKIIFDNSCTYNQITFTTKGTEGNLGKYGISMGNGIDLFFGSNYLVIQN